MNNVLAIAARPKSLGSMIGINKIIAGVRGHYKTGRFPHAWMFSGPTGTGKTTIARIIALSLHCSHQKEFGNPCEDCRKNEKSFDTLEVNASDVSGVDEIRKVAEAAYFVPTPPSRYRVIILDEAQRLSTAAQNLLLKYFEDAPKTTIWIIGTTEPTKILGTLRSRCVSYQLPGLRVEGVQELVKRALVWTKSSLDPEALSDALLENQISSPRMVLNAVEKYIAGSSAEESAQTETMEIKTNTKKVCQMVTNGEWKGLRGILKETPPEESRQVASAVMGWMASIVAGSLHSKKGMIYASGIREIEKILFLDDTTRRASLIAVLYQLTYQIGSGKLSDDPEDDE